MIVHVTFEYDVPQLNINTQASPSF